MHIGNDKSLPEMQIEKLVHKEVQAAEAEARDVETVMEQCLSSIERQFNKGSTSSPVGCLAEAKPQSAF